MTFDSGQIAVVGGTGRMGSWMAELLERRGHSVLRTGQRTDIRPEEAAESCSVVIVSVPLHQTIHVIRRVAPHVREDGLLMDLTSIKKAPLGAMLAFSRSQVVGLHPLFGPESDPENGPLSVAICQGRGRSGLRWITRVLRREGYRADVIDPDEHDRIMGVVQGVNHFTTLALALCISRSELPVDSLERWSTPSFSTALERIRKVLDQPDHLFRGLMTGTGFARAGIDQYRLAVKELAEAMSSEDGTQFKDLFRRLAGIFGNRG